VAENKALGRSSFAAAERLLSERLLGKEISRVSSSSFVKMKRTAPLLFRSVHRRIGMLEQFVEGMIVVRVDRNSDADADRDVMAL
jgi:hypothetical protein